MLETPLFGRFVGENRRLVFAPAAPYRFLVQGCIVGGICVAVTGIVAPVLGAPLPFFPGWWTITGTAVGLAGLFGALSLQSVVFDLKERTYRRRQGPGLFPTTTHGKLSELEAIVLMAEPGGRMMTGGVTYHLVLHWKGRREPLLLLQQDSRAIPAGAPLNHGAGALLAAGLNYARALGLPFYDNSHFASPCPISVWR